MNFILICGALVLAQPLAAPVVPAVITDAPTAEAAAPTLRLPALTPVRLRIIGEVSSKTYVKGDKIVIVLADPLYFSATLAIPAGTRGVAEVIHSAKGGMGASPANC